MYVCVACISRKVVPINAVEYFKIFFLHVKKHMQQHYCLSACIYACRYYCIYIYLYMYAGIYIAVRACVYAINLSRKYAFKLHFTV